MAFEKDGKIFTGLWEKTGKYGEYLNGTLEWQGKEYWVNVNNNSGKPNRKPNSPDYTMTLQEKDPNYKKASGGSFAPKENQAPAEEDNIPY